MDSNELYPSFEEFKDLLNSSYFTLEEIKLQTDTAVKVGYKSFYEYLQFQYYTNKHLFNNGSGIDLTINGSYEDIGPNSNSWSGSSTWIIGSSGTIIRTKGTSANNWKEHYEGSNVILLF
ncbi:MAG TPA: hypothetical protein VGF30_10135 [Bacteroidia bacterium]